MADCARRFCGARLTETFADLGMSPLSNSFISPAAANRMEPFYPVHAFVCGACWLVQLQEFESPEHIFRNYPYFSSISESWLRHAAAYADHMIKRFALGADAQVVEVASNDGYLLQYFVQHGIKVLGVEPAANVAAAAMRKGVPTDPQANAAGQRVFDVIVNGKTLVTNYDVFSVAGGENKAVELDLTVTATGGTGISLSLLSVGGYYGAFVNAIELDQTVAGLSAAPTATIQVSTDDGETWSLLATNVPINRFGEAQYNWTVDRTTTGSTGLIRVTSGTLTATSQPFLLANGGTQFYVDDSSLTGNQYTTAVGNDANSG